MVEAALAGATDAELDARPSDGGWTARETAHHIADSELTSAIRLRRLIAEDGAGDPRLRRQRVRPAPLLRRPPGRAGPGRDQRAPALGTAEILDRLTEAEWQRTGTHDEHPTYGVLEWLEIYAEHCHEHADQIKAALAEARDRPAVGTVSAAGCG